MEASRVRPFSGTKCVRSISANAVSRMRRSPSSRMNHCAVARKISGFFYRQECG